MEGIPFLPGQASTIADDVDILFYFISALTVFFTALIAVLVIWFSYRYRRRSEDEVPEQISGSTRLEIGWTVPLFGLAMIVFFWGAWLYVEMSTPPEESLEIYVLGKQWMWKYQHPDGQQEINDLHVPVGRPVKLTMSSEDVIHSYFVPAFRVKSDVLPGRYTTVWFEATEVGEYHMFCTEYCGTWHSRMVGTVYAMEEADYQEWLSGDQTRVGGRDVGGAPMGSPAELGEQLFTDASTGCSGCHRMEGGGPGPSLVGLFGSEVPLENGRTVVADENYIRTSILKPNEQIHEGYPAIMPTYEGQLSEEQLIQLIEYIKALGEDAAE